MPKIIPVLLWIIVALMLSVLLYLRSSNRPQNVWDQTPGVAAHPNDPPGAVLVDVPWKHFPDVPRFDLTDQRGQTFDSASLAGKTCLVSFFFATCPDICRRLNDQLARLNDQLKKEEVVFVSITVDPEHDSPEVLARYARDYGADPKRWVFLTGQPYKVRELGEQVFEVVVDKATHTDDILLIDNWGRYRDRFKWNDAYDMKRLVSVVQDVSVEQEPPLNKKIHTRNVLAGQPPIDFKKLPWLREFHLTDQHNQAFYSRDLTGQVWIGNFFFVSCPGICKRQIAYLRGLRERLGKDCPHIVSVTTDPTNDTPSVLNEFSKKQNANRSWSFCTGPDLLTRRIASEFFKAYVANGHHSSELFVVDRWHRVRGRFDWRDPDEEVAMLQLVKELRNETLPTVIPGEPSVSERADRGSLEGKQDEALTE